MYLTADSLLEVRIGYYPILIPIKFLVNIVKDFITNFNTPVIKVKLEFSCLNASRLFLAEVMERLLNALPLILYLFKYCFHDLVLVIFHNMTLFLELSDFSLILLSIILEGRIQNRVMPEVETLHRVNGISHPS
jgi:hypothetical protein